MANKDDIDITILFQQGDTVRNAIRRGGMEAMKRHIQAGVPMVGCKDGRKVHIQPEELKIMLAELEREQP